MTSSLMVTHNVYYVKYYANSFHIALNRVFRCTAMLSNGTTMIAPGVLSV